MSKKNDVEQHSVVVTNAPNANVVPYLFSLDRIEKTNCNLCQCEFRDEAEDIYENQKRKNYSEIKRRLKQNHDFDATVGGIKNHMLFHYKAAQNNAALQEYAEDVQQWVNMQTNKLVAMKSRIAVLEREMFTLGKESEELDISERRKNAETMKKLAETILTYENKLSEYQEEVKPVNLVFNQLKVIVNDELAHVDNIKTRTVVSTILKRLNDSVGEMMIE
jgi:hypothetical protein